jgi:DNA primase
MARIPEDEIERIKREVPVADIARALGIDLKPHGANLIGLCPFHDDHEPSFVVTPAKNLWHCLGACQAGGTNFDLVMKAYGVSFRHAYEMLRSGSYASAPPSRIKRATTPAPSTALRAGLPLLADPEVSNDELMRQVVRFYHETLKQSPEALAYLESRGLRSAEMIEHFQLGFANRTLGYRLPFKKHETGATIRSRLQTLGILRESGHEHFTGSLVIPIFDEHGNTSEIYGRKITPGLRQGTPLHLYLPGPHKGVWNVEALRASKEIILCEALIDALTFWCAGFRNVTASYGVEGFTEDHIAAFKSYRTERVLIAYDRDEAGEKAALKLAAKLQAYNIGCYRVEFPKDMDANEYALKVQPAAKSLALLLRTARWLGEGPRPEITSVPAIIDIEIHAEPTDAAKAETSPLLSAAEEPVPVTNESTVAVSLAAEPDTARLSDHHPSLPEVPTELRGEEIIIRLGDRTYRVRGLAKNTSYEQLQVNLRAMRLSAVPGTAQAGATAHSTGSGQAYHVNNLNLYAGRQRREFIKEAAEELAVKEDVIKKDLGKVLLKLEELQDELIRKTLEPKEKAVTLTEEEQAEALDLLKDPDLLQRILGDFERAGIVGEETNKLVGYLAAVSRKLDEPLAVIIQSSSAAGKSALMEGILAFVPEEERVKYSAMTGQSLFYMGETDLKHKILAIVEGEGAERASYALKLLQSEGELTIASTGKDPQTGKLVTHEYRVEGPVMLFLTTTAIEIEDELLNRCLVLTVNEDREQTRAIHRLQRERQTLEGQLARQDRNETLKLHQNAQRLLKPILVANPFAKELTFLDTRTRTRRDHMKYLTLIRTIALLHQYQRPLNTITHNGRAVDYIEVTAGDIAIANKLAHEVLGRSLDELSPQTRRLLHALDQIVTDGCRRLEMDRQDFRFSRRELREHTQWTDFQVKSHMKKLEDLEYVLVHRGGRGQSFVYELLYNGEGQDGRPFLIGLINPADLRNYDGKKEHAPDHLEHGNGEKEPSRSIQVAPKEHASSIGSKSLSPLCDNDESDSGAETAENAHQGNGEHAPSYVVPDRSNGAAPGLVAAPAASRS